MLNLTGIAGVCAQKLWSGVHLTFWSLLSASVPSVQLRSSIHLEPVFMARFVLLPTEHRLTSRVQALSCKHLILASHIFAWVNFARLPESIVVGIFVPTLSSGSRIGKPAGHASSRGVFVDEYWCVS